MPLLRRWISLACVTACAAAGPATKPSVSTQHDEVRVTTAYNRRTLVDAYDGVGQRDPKWDAPARALLERMASRFAEASVDGLYKSGIDHSIDTMLALSDAAKDCPDPLVGYCRAVILRDAGRQEEYLGLLHDVCPKLIDGPYPLHRRAYAAHAMAREFPKETQWAKKRDELFVPLLLEKTADPRERRFVLSNLIDTA